MVQPNGANLVFILSTPRAGSTLLGAILGNHSRLFSPNEPWLLLALHSLTEERSRAGAWSNEHLAALALRDLLSEAQFREACRAFALSAYNQKLEQAGKLIFIDKTPRYGQILPFLDELFPDAKKIWLQRNPLDVAVSFASMWNILIPELVGENFTVNSLDMTLGLSNYIEYFKGQKNTFELQYEYLVTNASAAIRDICHFLGVTSEPGMENYSPADGILSDMKTQLMGDKNIFTHSRPHAASIGKWKQTLAPADIQKLVDAIGSRPFERMGYTETIRELEQSGIRFPSGAELENRMRLLRKKARNFSTEIATPPAPAGAPVSRRQHDHWWIRLGRNLGLRKL